MRACGHRARLANEGPRFGTHNFALPLQSGQYTEVVCSLDHPATEQTTWGKAVSEKAQEGGGWLIANHPSQDGKAVATIEKITISDTNHLQILGLRQRSLVD